MNHGLLINQILKRLEAIETKLGIETPVQEKEISPVQELDPLLETTRKIVVLKKIHELRKKGASYREIADALNKNKTPTFSHKGKWYCQSIHRLVNKGKP